MVDDTEPGLPTEQHKKRKTKRNSKNDRKAKTSKYTGRYTDDDSTEC